MSVAIRFDPHLDFQTDAIDSVVDLFNGMPTITSQVSPEWYELETAENVSSFVYPNARAIDEDLLAENLKRVQDRNGIPNDSRGFGPNGELNDRDISVEMETGTGKTYVYLRTIMEMHKRYGLTKFLIVVPSLAVREGVLATLDLLADHFRGLYDGTPIERFIYSSKGLSRVRAYGIGSALQVMVMNIQAFERTDSNIIHQHSDRMMGARPIEYITATRPVVILDEPQNLESARRREAIESLNPLLVLRYSATHRDARHLVYRLTPVDAYQRGLVKRIEVLSITDDDDFSHPHLRVDQVRATTRNVKAKLTIDVNTASGSERRTVQVGVNDDLYDLSGERQGYAGWIVDDIRTDPERVIFTNGVAVSVGAEAGAGADEIQRLQVLETVRAHLDRELALRGRSTDQKIKVLSLFFINRVAHYVDDEGKVRQWFVEAYEQLSADAKYRELSLPPVAEVHGGYFAENRRHEARDTRGESEADERAYELIMRAKEKLLSPDEPLRFIFSHSALREGWDNPNVFQVCVLRDVGSEIDRRQQVGRGLRLPVQANGDRCHDDAVNRLLVIAAESYADFASALQREIREQTGFDFPEKGITDRRKVKTVKVRKGYDTNEDFLGLWDRIKHRTRYRVSFDSDELIARSVQRLDGNPVPIVAPRLQIRRGRVDVTKEGVESTSAGAARMVETTVRPRVPDLVTILSQRTNLSRATVAAFLSKTTRLGQVLLNPDTFIALTVDALSYELNELLAEGILYERIAGEEYEMRLFEEPMDISEANLVRLKNQERSIYDELEYQSTPERELITALDDREDILLFFKLPRWFVVETPVGPYNPDWAIVKRDSDGVNRLYLVTETKGNLSDQELRFREVLKTRFAKRHFAQTAPEVDYRRVTSASEV